MGRIFVGRAAAAALIGLYLGGCTTMGPKTAVTPTAGPLIAADQGNAAIDADIQRILAAGGIQSAPQLPTAAPGPLVAPPQLAAAGQQPVSGQQIGSSSDLPPSPTGTVQPTWVADTQDPAARLDFSALPVTDGTTDPITSTTATYDFSGQVSRPQMAGLMMPQAMPGAVNASVSAGILPSVPTSNVVTDVTGDNAQPIAQRPRRAVVPVLPVAMPARIVAVRQGVPRPGPASSAMAMQPPVTAPGPTTVTAVALPQLMAPVVNTDRPLQPIKRF